LFGFGGEALHLFELRDVAGEGQGLAAARLDEVDGLLAAAELDVGADHAAAARGELEGEGAPDAAARAGDNR
jgi:hypothetical protein